MHHLSVNIGGRGGCQVNARVRVCVCGGGVYMFGTQSLKPVFICCRCHSSFATFSVNTLEISSTPLSIVMSREARSSRVPPNERPQWMFLQLNTGAHAHRLNAVSSHCDRNGDFLVYPPSVGGTYLLQEMFISSFLHRDSSQLHLLLE